MLLNKLLLGAIVSASLIALQVANDEAHTDSIYLPRKPKTSSEMTIGALEV